MSICYCLFENIEKRLKFLLLPTKIISMWGNGLTNLTVVIVLQYTHIKTTNVYLKLTNFISTDMSIVFNKAEGIKKLKITNMSKNKE